MKDGNDKHTNDFFHDAPEEKRKRGRPKQYETNAEKQKAYRAKIKAEGKRVVSRVLIDTRNKEKPVSSKLIDLSGSASNHSSKDDFGLSLNSVILSDLEPEMLNWLGSKEGSSLQEKVKRILKKVMIFEKS